MVVVAQIRQVLGEVGEVVADSSLEVVAEIAIDREQRTRLPLVEARHVEQALRRLALARPAVGIQLKHEGRSLLSVVAQQSEQGMRERIAALCGEEFLRNAVYREAEAGGMRLHGWIALPSFSRAQADLQFLSVNGRAVRDKLLAMREAMQQLPPPALPDSFELSLRRSIKREAATLDGAKQRAGRRWSPAVISAAAALLLAASGLLLWLSLRQPKSSPAI